MSDLSEDPKLIAERMGLVVVEPCENELLLDIDDAESETMLAGALHLLTKNGVTVTEVRRTVSKSGHAHVYLKSDDFGQITPMLRVAIQACLGSDRRRELYSILRIVRAYPIPPTVLFEVRSTEAA